MKKIVLLIVILATVHVPGRSFNDNIVDYTFSQTTGTFNSIHTTGTYVAAGCTSNTFGNLPIGFAFVYNGTSYSQFGLCCSGWISMGPAVPNTSAFPLSTGIANNVISPFGAQLTSTVAGDGIYYKTEGSSPSRILTVEWWQYGFWLNGFDEICFQIKLYETTNQISFVYTTNDELSIRNVQVGLRGSSNADFVNRQTTTNWSQTTAGTTNTASCLFSPGITPSAGLTFTFTPPPVSVVSINSEVPENFALYQNYPNPFNPTTKIRFSIPLLRGVDAEGGRGVSVRLTILDILGREVALLVDEQLQPGTYEAEWNSSNCSSGLYYYSLLVNTPRPDESGHPSQEGNYIETKKMILIK